MELYNKTGHITTSRLKFKRNNMRTTSKLAYLFLKPVQLAEEISNSN